MRTWIPVALTVTLLLAGVAAMAQGEGTKAPDVGGAAPDFRLNDQDGKAVQLSKLRESGWTILAFFPKAMTPG